MESHYHSKVGSNYVGYRPRPVAPPGEGLVVQIESSSLIKRIASLAVRGLARLDTFDKPGPSLLTPDYGSTVRVSELPLIELPSDELI
ncbi:MAG TPA: hypothetical protein VLF39_00545 [Candidatus Saccharimonadales bacterium]|nr:hypothetical protein [Candidatus Saccharimonadales bacterium]